MYVIPKSLTCEDGPSPCAAFSEILPIPSTEYLVITLDWSITSTGESHDTRVAASTKDSHRTVVNFCRLEVRKAFEKVISGEVSDVEVFQEQRSSPHWWNVTGMALHYMHCTAIYNENGKRVEQISGISKNYVRNNSDTDCLNFSFELSNSGSWL